MAFAPTSGRGSLGRTRLTIAGFPVQIDGASIVVPGLYFVGIHFLRKRKSSLLIRVGEDAGIIARDIGRRNNAS